MVKRRRDKTRAELVPAIALPSRAVPRRLRVERDLLEQLIAMIGRLRDPRVSGASVTRVELTEDLQFARVYVRPGLEGGEPKTMVRGLAAAAGHLRTELSRNMSLRKAPELRFIEDRGLEAAERVEELLAEIRAEETDE